MKFVISGGTGFIGSYLLRSLAQNHHAIVVLTRSSSRQPVELNHSVARYVQWDPRHAGTWQKEIDGADVIINLAGKNVFENRWNERAKQEIRSSRVIPTQLIVDAIAAAAKKPPVLISVSAVGYYGDRGEELINEQSSSGNDFLAGIVQEWERAAYRAEQFGVRVATPRIGLVLQKNDGMIGRMLLPFRLFVGGPIGSGKQYVPWIHMEDVVRGILFPVEHSTLSGVYNLVSPNPVTMKEFAKLFGSVIHRPAFFPVPPFVLTMLFGEGGKVILSGQRAYPEKLISSGFTFSFPLPGPALQNILTGKNVL
jgi:hypothetical protein